MKVLPQFTNSKRYFWFIAVPQVCVLCKKFHFEYNTNTKPTLHFSRGRPFISIGASMTAAVVETLCGLSSRKLLPSLPQPYLLRDCRSRSSNLKWTMTTSGQKGHLPCVWWRWIPVLYRDISIDVCQLGGVRFYHHGEMRGDWGCCSISQFLHSCISFYLTFLSNIFIFSKQSTGVVIIYSS